jgi:hypothetical protein
MEYISTIWNKLWIITEISDFDDDIIDYIEFIIDQVIKLLYKLMVVNLYEVLSIESIDTFINMIMCNYAN